MKTLKKISLKSASVLDDKQLKQIYGGSGVTTEENCSDKAKDQCKGNCEVRIDGTLFGKGECEWDMAVGTTKFICFCNVAKK